MNLNIPFSFSDFSVIVALGLMISSLWMWLGGHGWDQKIFIGFQKFVMIWFDLLKWLIILSVIIFAEASSQDPILKLIQSVSILFFYLYITILGLHYSISIYAKLWESLLGGQNNLLKNWQNLPKAIQLVIALSALLIGWTVCTIILIWITNYIPQLMTILEEK
jgi:hypothetical protein